MIHIAFSSIGYQELGLERAIEIRLQDIAKEANIELEKEGISQLLEELIIKLSNQNQVVILIDEYDKPIIDYLDNIEQARANQRVLKTFYSVLKEADAHLKFLFITGVSKFSKVSIFSELNNLTDLTIHPKFATLVGYTQKELEEYFEDYLEDLIGEFTPDRQTLLSSIKTWYNGYSWDGKNFVYNPFSVLSFFGAGQFQNFWFSTGTPTFLINLLKDRNFYNISTTEVGQAALDSFEIENLETYALLFQTGYMTIKSAKEFGIYTLDYPNREVKDSMLQYLVASFSHGSYARTTPIVLNLRSAFTNHQTEEIIKIINGLFKSIPAPIFIRSKEAYYHSVIVLVFQYLGLFIDAEVHTSDGRIDAVVQTESRIYILEFKLDESTEAALQQIREKAYADQFRLSAKELVAFGINFDSTTKSVGEWKVEIL